MRNKVPRSGLSCCRPSLQTANQARGDLIWACLSCLQKRSGTNSPDQGLYSYYSIGAGGAHISSLKQSYSDTAGDSLGIPSILGQLWVGYCPLSRPVLYPPALGHLLGMYVTKAPPRFSSYAIIGIPISIKTNIH